MDINSHSALAAVLEAEATATNQFKQSTTLADIRRDPDRLLEEEELVALFGKSRAWAQRARWAGTGPKFIRVGRSIRYLGKDVLLWLEERTRTSTSDNG